MKLFGQEILIGCDPEVAVVNEKGELVSAHGLIKGTKDNPQLVKNGMVQVDGLALEFGIEPAKTETQFVTRINSVMKQLKGMLPKGYEFYTKPSFVFSNEVIDAQPPEALELGCDPDYDAYTLGKNPRPKLPMKGFRSAGGHVHIGWTKTKDCGSDEHMMDCAALSIELDYLLGVPSMGWDSDSQRRKLYGGPGAFRPKSYGMEYRTLSNQWIFSEDTMRFAYRNTIKAVGNLLANNSAAEKKLSLYSNTVTPSAKAIINQGFSALGIS